MYIAKNGVHVGRSLHQGLVDKRRRLNYKPRAWGMTDRIQKMEPCEEKWFGIFLESLWRKLRRHHKTIL